MNLRRIRPPALLTVLLAALLCQPVAAKPARAGALRFGVIGHSFRSGPDDTILRQAIKQTDHAKLAFVVVGGIKAEGEACSDKLYARRMELLEDSQRPLVLSLAAGDWSGCKNSLGKSNAIERLNRLRELFFADDNSLGARKITLSRLSSSAKFRSYAENAHWEAGRVLFATVNLPANNNHFLPEAGRNSEFEDRLVANRAWLQRLFAMAQRKKLDGIVLFSDGDVGVQTQQGKSLLPSFDTKQDGFAGTRRQILALSKKFSGKVLLVDTESGKNPAPPAIAWRDNLGHISVNADWVGFSVHPGRTPLFDIDDADPAPP